MSQYLVSIPFEADNVNMISNPLVIGYPSLCGVQGFVHNLGIRLMRAGVEAEVGAWALGLYRCEMAAGTRKMAHYEKSRRKKVEQSPGQPPLVDQRRGSVGGYLLIDIASEGIDPLALIEAIESIVSGQRFCGGNLFLKGIVRTHDSLRDALVSLRSARPVFFAEDATHTLPTENRLEALLDAVSFKSGGREEVDEADYRGFLVPAHIGYITLEAPSEKPSTRQLDADVAKGRTVLHAWTEDQVGLIRQRSLPSVIAACNQDADGEFDNIFWQPRTVQHANATEFLVSAI